MQKFSNIYRNLRYAWPLHFTLLFTNWLPDNVVFLRMRGFLIKQYFKKTGKDLRIARNNTFYNSHNIEIGAHVYIGDGNWFNGAGTIIIEDEVMFGPKSIFATNNHTKIEKSYRYGPGKLSPIHIKKGSWIGGNCTILSGSVIGMGSIIGANTVVNKSVPDSVLFAGNPGNVIKEV